LKIALDELDRYKQGGRGSSITYVAVLAGRVVIGSSSGSKPASADTSATVNSVPVPQDNQTKPTAEGNQNSIATNGDKPSSSERTAVTGEAKQKKHDRKHSSTKDKEAGSAPRVP
jgi:hypothetical protein